jgi:hypothetical protein
MSKKQRHPKDTEMRKQIARRVKRRLAALIVFLVALLLLLILGLGQEQWPGWLISYRAQVEGILSLAIILLILVSPLVIESSSNPRALSGPGKNPEGPRLD